MEGLQEVYINSTRYEVSIDQISSLISEKIAEILK